MREEAEEDEPAADYVHVEAEEAADLVDNKLDDLQSLPSFAMVCRLPDCPRVLRKCTLPCQIYLARGGQLGRFVSWPRGL